MININYLAVLVAAVASMVVGFLWYGPIFGKKWMALSGITRTDIDKSKDKGMGKSYLLAFIGALLTAYTLYYFIFFANTYFDKWGAMAGMASGFWAWLGFVVPLTLGSVLWEGKSWKLWTLNNSYHLINLLLFGAILSSWM